MNYFFSTLWHSNIFRKKVKHELYIFTFKNTVCRQYYSVEKYTKQIFDYPYVGKVTKKKKIVSENVSAQEA